MLQGKTNLQVVSIIETVHVDVPGGMLSGGSGVGSGFEVMILID